MIKYARQLKSLTGEVYTRLTQDTNFSPFLEKFGCSTLITEEDKKEFKKIKTILTECKELIKTIEKELDKNLK